jgi:hypothetical protein
MKGDDSGEEECKGYKYLRGSSVKLTRKGRVWIAVLENAP